MASRVCDGESAQGRLAATVALCCVSTKRVLLGLRFHEPWRDYYCWPGGKLEMGETPEQAAFRELREETGIEIVKPHILKARNVCLQTPDGTQKFNVTSFLCGVDDEPTPQRSTELHAAWFTFDDARKLLMTKESLAVLEALRVLVS